jgi:hypothetical protein
MDESCIGPGSFPGAQSFCACSRSSVPEFNTDPNPVAMRGG